MWRPYLLTSEARDLEAALSGQASAGEAAIALAAFIGEVADAMAPDKPFVSDRGRERLMAALAAKPRERNARRGVLAPVRTGALAAATVAGSGVIVVSAATGTSPVTVVKDAVQEIPAITGQANAPAGVLAIEAAVSGVVVATHGEGFDLETATGIVDVSVSRGTPIRDEDGVPLGSDAIVAGTNVEVRGALAGGQLRADIVIARRGLRAGGGEAQGIEPAVRAPGDTGPGATPPEPRPAAGTPLAESTPEPTAAAAREPEATREPTLERPPETSEPTRPAPEVTRTPEAGAATPSRTAEATRSAAPTRPAAVTATANTGADDPATAATAGAKTPTPTPTPTPRPTSITSSTSTTVTAEPTATPSLTEDHAPVPKNDPRNPTSQGLNLSESGDGGDIDR